MDDTDYVITISLGHIFAKENAYLLKGALNGQADDLFDGNELIGSLADLYDNGLREFGQSFYGDDIFSISRSKDWATEKIEETFILHLLQDDIGFDRSESTMFTAFNTKNNLKLTKEEKKAVAELNEKYFFPYGHKPIKFKPVVWLRVG